ncbi:MAG: peptidylprolyl isomerase [Kiritimatiellia bacterium]
MKHNLFLVLLAGLGCIANADETQRKTAPLKSNHSEESEKVQILIETSLGNIKAELYPEKAPLTVSNVLHYVDSRFYDETIFHRVINGFMIQGGGFKKEMIQKNTESPVKNEADNGLSNTRGTLAMARTMEVNSATSQFFINLVDRNSFLDHKSATDRGWGYCVFGKVVDGMDVVDEIAKTPTGNVGPFQNVPKTPVVIKRIRRVETEEKTTE